MKKFNIMLCLVVVMAASIPMHAQLSIDKVKNIFGKKELGKIGRHLQFLSTLNLENNTNDSTEEELVNYIGQQFGSLLYKPYLGKFVHPFRVDKKSSLSNDSYLRIFNNNLLPDKDFILLPFSGTGASSVQALPGVSEYDNIWLIKLSELGINTNNTNIRLLDSLYKNAHEAIEQGAKAIMFLNDVSAQLNWNATSSDKYTSLIKPVFMLNNEAYKKYLTSAGSVKDWIPIDYSFSTQKSTADAYNVIGYWQNQTPLTVIITTRIDKVPGMVPNASGISALLDVAERIHNARPTKYNYLLVGLSGTADAQAGVEALLNTFRLTSSNVNCVINIGDVGATSSANQLYVSGTGTSIGWNDVLSNFDQNFLLSKIVSGELGKDNHLAFYKHNMPVLNIFTKRALADKLNNEDRIMTVSTAIADMVMKIDGMPKFTFSKTKELPNLEKIKSKVNMGIVPDYAFGDKGLLIGAVQPGSAAALSNVIKGDVLINIDGHDVLSADDYIREIVKYKKGDRIMIKVKRNEIEKQMLITFR